MEDTPPQNSDRPPYPDNDPVDELDGDVSVNANSSDFPDVRVVNYPETDFEIYEGRRYVVDDEDNPEIKEVIVKSLNLEQNEAVIEAIELVNTDNGVDEVRDSYYESLDRIENFIRKRIFIPYPFDSPGRDGGGGERIRY